MKKTDKTKKKKTNKLTAHTATFSPTSNDSKTIYYLYNTKKYINAGCKKMLTKSPIE